MRTIDEEVVAETAMAPAADAPRGRRRRVLAAAVVAAAALLGGTLAMIARDAAGTDVSQGGVGSSPDDAAATTGQEPTPSEPAPAPAPAPEAGPAATPSSCPAPSAAPPEPRYGAAVSAEPAGLLVLGGRAADGTDYADGWSFACGKWARPATPQPAVGFDGLAVYDAARNATVLLAADNTTWTNAGGAWAPRRPATSPTRLYAASLVYDEAGRRALLFGSPMKGDGNPTELWSWDGAIWTLLSQDGPSRRGDAGVAWDAKAKRLVVFGGLRSFGDSGLDDTWTWDGTRWATLTPAHTPAKGPAMAAYDAARGQVVLLDHDNATWTWDGADWTLRAPASSPNPGYRGFAAMTWLPGLDRVVVFGGKRFEMPQGDEPGKNWYGNDLWAWDGSTWTRVS